VPRRTITVSGRSASLTASDYREGDNTIPITLRADAATYQSLEGLTLGITSEEITQMLLVGIPFGLLATGQPLSFFGTLGIISLAGIIINNAIVLIDQIDIERSHLELREAIVAASQKRLRPILLTSATTVLGLAPMAIAGGALWQPMAVLMMSGLAVASLLTLLFVPACYFLLFRFDKASART
jgi:multidrug efflux pump subunit AcrB